MARRLVSLLLMLSFGFFTAEVAMADSCDGDATITSVKAPADSDGGPASQGSPVGTHNVPHVCHCAHAHGTLNPDVARLGAPRLVAATMGTLAVLGPASVDLDLHLRPPIAFSLFG